MNTFKNNLQLFNTYDKIVQEQKNIGTIQQAHSSQETGYVGGLYYMPHKPVVLEDKPSMKVRMVFD